MSGGNVRGKCPDTHCYIIIKEHREGGKGRAMEEFRGRGVKCEGRIGMAKKIEEKEVS